MVIVTGPGWTQFLGFITFAIWQTIATIYISVMYFMIHRIIASHYQDQRRLIAAQEHSEAKRLEASISEEKSLNITLIMILLIFVIVWTPFAVILGLSTAYQVSNLRPGPWIQDGFMWTGILTYYNGAINPFIYATRYRELGFHIKKQARKIICCLRWSASVTDGSRRANPEQLTDNRTNSTTHNS